jgi:hypothetical protein
MRAKLKAASNQEPVTETMSDLLPLSRRFGVVNLRPDGLVIAVVPTDAEQVAIAAALAIPSVRNLRGAITATPGRKGSVAVTGLVSADIVQTCVVTLDEFETHVEEPVDLEFIPRPEPVASLAAKPAKGPKPGQPRDIEEFDEPDYIDNGEIDFGALTVEFLALALDPYPRKPGASFDFKDEADQEEKPFAALARFRKPE